MSAKTSAIPATLTIDPAALAALVAPGGSSSAITDALNRIEALMKDVAKALDGANVLAVDGDEAARRLSISRRHLQDIDGLKSFTIGTRRLWAVADLQAFIEKQKTK